MLTKTTIRTRLLTLAILPLLVLLAVIAMAVFNASRLNNNLDHLFTDRMKPVSQLKTVSDSYAVIMVDTLHKYRAGLFDAARLHKEFDAARQKGSQAWKEYTATRLTEEEKRRVSELDQALSQVNTLVGQLLQEADAGQLRTAEASAFNQRLYGTFDPLQSQLSGLIELQLHEGANLYAASTEHYESMRATFLLIGAAALILVMLAAIVIILSILRPLSQLRSVITRVQETSNLTLRAEVLGNDEVSETARAFNALVEHQQTLILHLVQTASQLAVASEEMNAISTQVSSTATQQGDQTHMVATAVHEMSMAVQEVANNALAAAGSASDANQQARQGSGLVHASVRSIQDVSVSVGKAGEVIDSLHSQSAEISKVLGVIQSIAAKTNLLALNAAIEAARAGEAGRGFAVVADEVRALASSTQEATESIRVMIDSLQSGARGAVEAVQQSREQVNACVQQANEAGDALNYITRAVETIAAGNEQISTATEEQTSVANEISQNITRLNSSISEVVNGAQQSLSASQELAIMASRLKDQTQRFTA
ncbi:methyl-accepting chemotaxis protein [Pseudomonas sp. 3A(2025)]